MTPMMQQYKEIKAQNPDCFLFFRLGDFYEMFFEDAIQASSVLNITLTRRGRDEVDAVPMCGVPFHAADGYIARLVRAGHSVAICDQVEEVSEAKKRGAKSVVKRAVTRIITPGTLTEDTLLDSKVNNFLMALAPDHEAQNCGIAIIDISTGTLLVDRSSFSDLPQILYRFDPREIVTTSPLFSKLRSLEGFKDWVLKTKTMPDARWDFQNAKRRLLEIFCVKTLDGFVQLDELETQSLGVLLDYVQLTQVGALPRLNIPKKIRVSPILEIDAATQKNLEVFDSASGDNAKSLLSYMDETVTPGGGRLLRLFLSAPLAEAGAIEERLEHVDYFYQNQEVQARLHGRLKGFPDVDRALSRLSLGRGSARDLGVMRDGLLCACDLLEDILNLELPSKTEALFQVDSDLMPLRDQLVEALDVGLPLLVRDGGFIRAGYNQALDCVRELRDEGRQKVADMQAHYAQELGIGSLKIKHNNVLGYHIEVTSTHLSKIPESFIHRQTTANTARYTTIALSELEQRLMSAGQEALQIELQLFETLVQKVLCVGEHLSKLAGNLAYLDVMVTFARIARRYGYVRPTIDATSAFAIQGGRHPIIERVLDHNQETFKANDCKLEGDQLLWLITGPNMAGKSTFLRQNALIVVMGQMGSYVPARQAHFGVVDRLFSRVGASDDLARGHSTFMVEMVETAMILNNATSRSLVILDEVGRGTSTHDGLSIAWAVIEHIHTVLQCRGLFATHYHELTSLEDKLPKIHCATMRVKEWENKVIFLHEMIQGVADKSYGIHVAELAGVPKAVIKRAYGILDHLSDPHVSPEQSLQALPLFKERQVVESLHSPSELRALTLKKMVDDLRVDELSPRQALEFLYDLKSAKPQDEVA
jgi:DNA mismatch repair protein MutS